MYQRGDNEIFHVHTKRCKHAGEEEDYLYVESAINLRADRIVFMDHAPFPENPFGNRMGIEELPEYVASMKALKKEYAGHIEVMAGLEVEYLPSYLSYYKELHDSGDFDLLMIGQHFYENEDGTFSFHNADKADEFKGLSAATVKGIETGLFDVVAHPDRIFRSCKYWNTDMMNASYDIIEAANAHQVYLEKNYTSQRRKNQYWDPFWVRVGRTHWLNGYDAHSVAEMEKIRLRTSSMLTQTEINSLFSSIEGEQKPE